MVDDPWRGREGGGEREREEKERENGKWLCGEESIN